MKYGAIAIRGGTAGMDSFSAEFTVLHLMTPRKSGLSPIRRLSTCCRRGDRMPSMNQAIKETRQAYVLVNNRSEGNAPLTVQILVERPQTDP